ncbi:hypothetical protein GCM10028798_34770 [Humibacter antri]
MTRELVPGTRPAGWVLRAIVGLHLVAIIGQPVFAGMLLAGDHEALSLHRIGADVVTGIGYAQVIVAVVVWRRLRVLWPLATSVAIAVSETLQYYVGMHGPIWVHIPLGVFIVAAVVVQVVAAWMLPITRRNAPPPPLPPVE